MRNQNRSFALYICISVFLLSVVGLESVAAPAQNGNHAIFVVYAAALQDAGQAATPTVTVPSSMPPQPPKVELPDGDGKAIATEYCQDCHRLTNLTRAHKSLDDWKDTVQLMIDRGARIPPENVDGLVQYLAKNFGPLPATAAPDGTGAPTAAAAPASTGTPAVAVSPAPAVPAASSTPTTTGQSPVGASPEGATAAASTQPKAVVLPDGPGKEIATEVCQECHRLTNLTNAHKSLDDWKDTVQLMMDRGADIPPDKVDILIQYLAKNFGPKATDAGASAPSGGAVHGSSAQSQ